MFWTFALVFGGLAGGFTLAGEWKAAGGAVIMAVLVGVPLFLVMLTVRWVRQAQRDRTNRREYGAGLASRSDQEHQAMMDGDIDAGVFGAFQPPRLDRKDLPDAEQMRQQAWQPEVSDQEPAVRPKNPAPWHVVTQFPTQQFRPLSGSKTVADDGPLPGHESPG